jgi:hypothetical protein
LALAYIGACGYVEIEKKGKEGNREERELAFYVYW